MDLKLVGALGWGVWVLALAGGCGGAGTSTVPERDAGMDAGGDASVDGGGDGGGNPDEDAVPTVKITSPQSGDTVGQGTLRIEGEASDDRAMSSVQVRVGPNVAVRAHSSDNFKHFWIESPVPPGEFVVEAVAIDSAEQKSEPSTVTLTAPEADTDDGAPTITIASPEDGSQPAQTLALVTGTTTDDRGVVEVEVELNGEVIDERPVETSDFFENWARLVPLVPGEDNLLTFTARDAAGHEASATITLEGAVQTDRDAPTLGVDTPVSGAVITTATLTVNGTAGDNIGVREVKVRAAELVGADVDPVWGDYTFCTTDDGYATWTCEGVVLPLGPVVLQVKVIDLNGLVTKQSIPLDNQYVPEWTDEKGLPLRLRAPKPKPVLTLELDREGVNDVLNEDIQKDTRLLELDTTDLLTNALNDIKLRCGTDWQNDKRNPTYDCFDAGGDPWQQSGSWASSPEFATVRILTITPANVPVTGTSIEALQGIAGLLNVSGGAVGGAEGKFSTVLAETLGIGRKEEVVSTDALVQSLKDYLLSSHPNVLPGAKLPITLYDAMNDFEPLTATLGPCGLPNGACSGNHPGVVDPGYPVNSVLFDDNFQMLLEAESNLVWTEGVTVLGDGTTAGKEYTAVVRDDVGPTFDDVLEFDFEDPNKFDVTGLVENATVNLRFGLQEHDDFVPACTTETAGTSACQGNLPNAPLGGYVWSLDDWLAEKVVAGGAYNKYKNRVFNGSYGATIFIIPIANAARVRVGQNDNPPGWLSFSVILDLGDPPPDQYLWGLINEVAQVALHDPDEDGNPDFAEGEANPAFTLKDIDVGLTADEIRDAIRPELQKQRSKLSEQLLGDYAANNGAVDFYYALGADDAPYLFFVAESDPRPSDTYGYMNPGFFADPELTTKLSTTDAGTSGDDVHEKLPVVEGEATVYMQAEDGSVHRLRFVVGEDPTEIQVFVSRRAD